MSNFREQNTWLDKIDKNIMPYVDNELWISRYPTLSALIMRKEQKLFLQKISQEIFSALSRLVEALRSDNTKMPFDLFNMTNKLTPFIENDNSNLVSYLARLDFVKNKNGEYKLVEINSDTPCALPETFYANKIAEKYFAQMHNLSLIERSKGEELANPFLKLLKQEKYKRQEQVNIVFSADNGYEEDWANAKFLFETVKSVLQKQNLDLLVVKCRLVTLADLIIKDDGVYVKNEIFKKEDKIDILYRLHPLELLMDDESEDGFPVGLKLMELANWGLVDLVNPIKSIVLQNKALLALAWYLCEKKVFWHPEEEILLRKYLTPTYLDNSKLRGLRYISKPIFGREGAGISIIEATGMQSYESEECEDCDLVYQQFIDSVTVKQETDAGTIQGKYTYSCFVINGCASETFLRLQPGEITGAEAYFVPILDEI